MPSPDTASHILQFWFEDIEPKAWYQKDAEFDAHLAERFGPSVARALAGQIDDWAATPEGCLALILLLDQFTRNIFRDTPKAFIGDEMALAFSVKAHKAGWIAADDNQRHRQFYLMPMMHSEELSIQDMSLPLFQSLTGERTYKYAILHRDIIARFGQFPHRNEILGRPSSDEEISFLKQPHSSF